MVPQDDEINSILGDNSYNVEQMIFEYLTNAEKDGDISEGKDLEAIACLLFALYVEIKVIGKTDVDRDKLLKPVFLALNLIN